MAIPATNRFVKAAEHAGLKPPFDLRKIAVLVQLQPPISVRNLMGHMDPQVVILESGFMKAGKVSGTADLALCSTGQFSLKLDLHDSSELYGDEYKFTATFGGGDYTLKSSKHLGTGEDYSKQHDGVLASIEEHWTTISKQGWHWDLHVQPKVSAAEVPGLIVLGAAGVALVVGTIMGKGAWGKDDKGNPTYNVRLAGNGGTDGGEDNG
ncbi:MAG TPA: hypothetical protein VGQ38_10085 [Gaiellaceae bacterium]|jgi:hypothetical protein|nr:hypothetical protein [Gaiellaceae bacterium]